MKKTSSLPSNPYQPESDSSKPEEDSPTVPPESSPTVRSALLQGRRSSSRETDTQTKDSNNLETEV